MKCKQSNIHPYYNVNVRWTKSARWDVVPWTLTSLNKPRIYSSGWFVTQYYDEAGMYCVFIMDVLMCTAYTNLANAFLISFQSKNSDLSSMLAA